MQVTTELRPLFSYSILYIIFTIILIIFVLIITRYMKKKELKKKLIIPNHKDLLVINGYEGYIANKMFSVYTIRKNNIKFDTDLNMWEDMLFIVKYLTKIDNLIINFNNSKLSSRKAYQELSSIIRNFIYEVTNIQVQNYTLKDISTINMPILYQLVSEYYNPEFSKISKGNITLSINKTRMVIEKWN